MTSVFNFLLGIHIVAGTLGLLLGTVVMILKKGDQQHKRFGRLFAIAMISTGVSSLGLALLHPNSFLFAVGVFTIYMTITSWRYLRLRQLGQGQRVSNGDWLLQVAMAVACGWFLQQGITLLIEREPFGIVMVLFAWRGLAFVYQDYKTFRGARPAENYWLLFHLQRMIGAYIASLTAFAVVNTPDRLALVAWLLPTAILTPLIIRWSRKYRVPAGN